MAGVLLLIGSLEASGRRDPSADTSVADAEVETGMNSGTSTEHHVPQELATIPQDYYQAAEQQGTLAELNYNTYESKTYEQKRRVLTKRAIV